MASILIYFTPKLPVEPYSPEGPDHHTLDTLEVGRQDFNMFACLWLIPKVSDSDR